MTGVLLEIGSLGTDTPGKMFVPKEDEGRDRYDASTSQGTPKILSQPLEAKGEAWDRFSHSPQKESMLLKP